ncbi:MAG: SusC/RagA family TonB-linked outer membrane protein [Cellulophaga sp.]
MKTKRNGILTLLLAFVVHLSFAQEKTISGTVTDQDGLPLPGVNIIVQGTTNGTQTDFDGNYTINASTGQVLLFSYIGQKDTFKTVGTSNTIDVQMTEDAEALEEVVVTALGIKKSKKALGYAVQEVKSDEITRSGSSNVLDGIAGKSAGVQITRSSGSAGGGSRIVIRGVTSMVGNNQALIVIDGVRSNNETLNAQGSTAGTAQSNRLMDLNAEDIESLTVLKGAAATSLYGTAGSTGVIVIVTKKGSKGSALSVNFTSQLAFDQISSTVNLQNTFGQGRVYGGIPSYRGPETGESGSWGPRVSDLEYSKDMNVYNNLPANQRRGNPFDSEGNYLYDNNGFLVLKGQGNGQSANTYNDNDFFRTALSNTNSVSVSGGSEVATFRFSASSLNQEGIVPNEEYTRKTFNVGTTLQASESLSFGLTFNYTRSDYDRVQQGSNTSGLLLGLYRTPVTFDNSNGFAAKDAVNEVSAYELADGRQRNYRGGGGYDNPYWVINNAPGTEKVHRMFGSFKTNYSYNDWINLSLNVGVDVTSDTRKQVFEIGSRTEPNGSVTLDDFLTSQTDFNLLLTGQGDLSDDFNLNYLVGFNSFSFSRDRTNLKGQGLLFKGFTDTSNTSSLSGFESANKYRTIGLFSSVELAWRNIAYLTVTGRQDYDSRLLVPGTTFNSSDIGFFYPSISSSFIFTELLPKSDILSFGKFRASWAKVGAGPPRAYSTATAYVSNGPSGGWGDGITYPITGTTAFELSSTLGNNNLTPETTETIEFGVDLRFFNNKLTLDATYYENENKDAILSASLPSTTGYTSRWVNAGTMEGNGIEITLGAKPIVTENFSWNTQINWSKSETIVKELAPGIERLFLAGFGTAGTYLVKGNPYGAIVGGAYLRQETGTDSDTSLNIPGGPIVIDANTGYQAVDLKQRNIGDPNPDFIMGWNNTFVYKNLSLGFLLDWKEGGDIWNGTAWALSFFGRSELTAQTRVEKPTIIAGVVNDGNGNFSPNTKAVVRDRSYWTSAVGGFGSVGEQFVQDGGWIRLRELSLSYKFPSKLFENSKIKGAFVTFIGRNLWIDTDYDGVDPETSLTGNGNGQGFDYFNNPSTKTFMFKFGLNF